MVRLLALLDLSAAFDTVDHNILIDRLENWVGLTGPVLNWFRTYLTGREYFVALGDHSSKKHLYDLWGPSRFHFRVLTFQSIHATPW